MYKIFISSNDDFYVILKDDRKYLDISKKKNTLASILNWLIDCGVDKSNIEVVE